MKYILRVIKYEGDEVVREIRCRNKQVAEKAEDGVLRNMNHDDYYTEIKEQSNG